MSGPARDVLDPRDPVLVDGLLTGGPLVACHGHALVAQRGGTVVAPWRGHALAAQRAGCATVADWSDLPEASADLVVVHLAKGRSAVCLDLAGAWRVLREGGRLAVTGGNDLGAATWIRRIAEDLGRQPLVEASRAKSRAAAFTRQGPAPAAWAVDPATALFAGGGIDIGSALLIASLADLPTPRAVLDVGAGAGHLAGAARDRWPGVRLVLIDADARAIAVLRRRFPEPSTVITWWDASEPLTCPAVDLALCNPPCHAGSTQDLAAAMAMMDDAWKALAPGGRLRLVANRQLPYERHLAAWSTPHLVASDARFKVLEIRREAAHG